MGMQIDRRDSKGSISARNFALWQLGFRPFFLLAALWGVLSMGGWLTLYGATESVYWIQPYLSSSWWHAHGLVFGYSMAVISGFLLTAVRNWTALKTPTGFGLAGLASLWAGGRLLPLVPGVPFELAIACDLLFGAALVVVISLPLIRSGQKNNFFTFSSKLTTILVANAIFYLGALGYIEGGQRAGVYLGAYLILAIIFTISRRVFPTFITNAVQPDRPIESARFLDFASLAIFLVFTFVDVLWPVSPASGALAGLLFVIHLLRLRNWHRPGIWTRPLVWVLWVSYAWITFGFLLAAISSLGLVSSSQAIHAFTVGGIGMVTIGMMARVTLGHTGRDVFRPPPSIWLIFFMILLSAMIRVLVPLAAPQLYLPCILLSQLAWIIAFAVFIMQFGPMLVRVRIDGQPG